MKALNFAAGLLGLCLLAGSHGALADLLDGIYPTCRDPLDVEKAQSAAHREEWVEFLTMRCGLSAYRGITVRVVRCDAELRPVEMKRISGPVPLDESLPNNVCEVEVSESDGSTGTYYTHFHNIGKPRPVTSSGAVVADDLMGVFPTCREADQVRKAYEAERRRDSIARRATNCTGLFDIGTPVRVIRCAADVTPAEMERFSQPVPREESLPDQICEVEKFYEEGGSGIHYTFYFNIMKFP